MPRPKPIDFSQGCGLCVRGLIAIEGAPVITHAWMSYFTTVPCQCLFGKVHSACRLPDPCACHACSILEYAPMWAAYLLEGQKK